MTKIEDSIKLFGFNNQLLEINLESIEKEHQIELRSKKIGAVSNSSSYFEQFDLEFRKEASHMSKNYEIFYCLEKSIRDLIKTTLESSDKDWWKNKAPVKVVDDVKGRIKREQDSGVTLRSNDPIDFTTFGELSEIIKTNWTEFGSIFNSIKAVEKVMNNLNTLRGPIAHCSKLAEDEELRLRLAIRDWFRLME